MNFFTTTGKTFFNNTEIDNILFYKELQRKKQLVNSLSTFFVDMFCYKYVDIYSDEILDERLNSIWDSLKSVLSQ